jgi:hypothetical protein
MFNIQFDIKLFRAFLELKLMLGRTIKWLPFGTNQKARSLISSNSMLEWGTTRSSSTNTFLTKLPAMCLANVNIIVELHTEPAKR